MTGRFDHNPNKGSLRRNDDKVNNRAPDWKGGARIFLEQVEHTCKHCGAIDKYDHTIDRDIAGWDQRPANGIPIMSLAITPVWKPEPGQAREAAKAAARGQSMAPPVELDLFASDPLPPLEIYADDRSNVADASEQTMARPAEGAMAASPGSFNDPFDDPIPF